MINPDEHKTRGDTRSSAEIETDIRRTRGRMDDTLDEIGERLTARSLVNSALDWWEKRTGGRESNATSKAKDIYRSVARQVKEYPLPSLLIGAGIGWILVESASGDDEEENYSRPRRQRTHGTTAAGPAQPRHSALSPFGDGDESQRQEDGDGLGAKAHEMATQVKDSVSSAAEAAQEKLSDLGHAAVEQSRSVGRTVAHGVQSGYTAGAEQFQTAIEEYPLAVGIGFAALGALVGVLLPRTRREDELLGEQSDQLIDSAKEKSEEMLEAGKKVAERVGEAAVEEAKNQGLTADAEANAMSNVVEKAGEVARRARNEATTAAEDEGLTSEKLER